MNSDERDEAVAMSGGIEAIDPDLAERLALAREIPATAPHRRDLLRRRLEAELGDLGAIRTPGSGVVACSSTVPPRSRPSTRVAVAVAALAAALVVAVALWPPGVVSGSAATTTDRATIVLANRGVAILEAHSQLRWKIDRRAAALVQDSGRTFYRVEPGDPFVVETPASRVSVTGTSFEVEVEMNDRLKQLRSGAAGAVLAAVAVVTVYEGQVVLANDLGTATVEAGERASMGSDAAPERLGSRTHNAGGVDEEAPKSAGAATVDGRPSSSRAETVAMISDLRAQIRELERELGEAPKTAEQLEEEMSRKFVRNLFRPSKEELLEAAETCAVSYAMPTRIGDRFIVDSMADEIDLTAAERQAIEAALGQGEKQWEARVRSIYLDASGDEEGAEVLSVAAMELEIQEKALAEEELAARTQVSKERAGLLEARAAGESTPLEAYLRAAVARTDASAAAVSSVLGEDRGLELLERVGLHMNQYMGGCEPRN